MLADNSTSNPSGKIILAVRILDFESPVKLGNFLNFRYSIRDVSGINDKVTVNFNIETDGKKIVSDSDTFYISDVINNTLTSKIFLPSNMMSGVYTLNIEINYNGYVSKSYRTFEITVQNGIAMIDGSGGDNNATPKIWIIAPLVLLALLNIFLIYYFERKEINEALVKEEKFIIKYKLPFLILSLFLIFGALIHYLNLNSSLPKIIIYLYYLFFGILLALILIKMGLKEYASKDLVDFAGDKNPFENSKLSSNNPKKESNLETY